MTPLEQARAAAADPEALRRNLADADIVPLALSLAQLTGDDAPLRAVRPYVYGGWSFTQTVPKQAQGEIREALAEAILALAASDREIEADPPDALLKPMLELAAGEPVPEDYFAVFREEASFGGKDLRDVEWRRPPSSSTLENFRAVIIGAGFSGVAMAIKMKQAGIPFVIIEKNADIGGTWLENVYPGVGVDTPCHFFSYAFEFNSDWSSYFASGSEILAYLQSTARKHGVEKDIRFGEEVTGAEYDEATARWSVWTRRADGSEQRLDCNVLITAVGALNRPSIPSIEGLDRFEGPSFHTAQWDRSADLDGKRVAMIGTGASGMQTGPSIAPIVDKLTIFQRSPHWAILNPLYHANVSSAVRWAMKYVPFYASWFRFQLFWAASEQFHHTLKIDPEWRDPAHSLNAENDKMRQQLIAYIKEQLGERTDLLPKVIPDYPPFGKRMLRDNNWYKMLKRPNVELVTSGVDRITEHGVVADGVEHPADVIVFATGFQAKRMLWPMDVRGKGGRTLRDVWGEEDPRAYLGVTVPDFPNLFMIYGPNTNLAHGGSAIFHTECQVHYVMLALREMIESGSDAMEVREEPFQAYNQHLDAVMKDMVWSHPGVNNWYKNSKGRVVLNSPWRLGHYRNMTAELDVSHYDLTRVAKAG